MDLQRHKLTWLTISFLPSIDPSNYGSQDVLYSKFLTSQLNKSKKDHKISI